jgi:hypothetical protein
MRPGLWLMCFMTSPPFVGGASSISAGQQHDEGQDEDGAAARVHMTNSPFCKVPHSVRVSVAAGLQCWRRDHLRWLSGWEPARAALTLRRLRGRRRSTEVVKCIPEQHAEPARLLGRECQDQNSSLA